MNDYETMVEELRRNKAKGKMVMAGLCLVLISETSVRILSEEETATAYALIRQRLALYKKAAKARAAGAAK